MVNLSTKDEKAVCPERPPAKAAKRNETDPVRDRRAVGEHAACPHPPTLSEMEQDEPRLPATQEYLAKDRQRFAQEQERQIRSRK